MAIIGLKPGQVVHYIPEADRGSKDPCVIRIKYVSFGKVQEISDQLLDDVLEEARGVKDQDRYLRIKNKMSRESQRRQFIENVEGIDNYSIDGKPVTDPAEFYDAAEHELVLEIIRAMESSARLQAGQRKNSSGASGTA